MAGLLTGDGVDRTLRRWAESSLEWGLTDCALSVFLHIAEDWGCPRPYQKWVMTYRSESEAQAIINRLGGPMPAFADEMSAIKAKRTRDPERGDVGLLRDAKRRMVACICIGKERFAVRAATGFSTIRAKPLVAWTKPEE